MSRVCVQASVFGSGDQTRLVWGSLLRTSVCLHPCFKHILWFWSVHIICLQPFVSNTFDLGFLFVYMHQSPTLCLIHVWIVDPCLCVVSVLSQNDYEWYLLHGSDVYFAFLHVISGLVMGVVMGTSMVAWMPLPLPCPVAGVRESCNKRIFLSVLHHVDVLSRNFSTPTFETPGFMCADPSRAVTKFGSQSHRGLCSLVRKSVQREMHSCLSKRPSLTRSVELFLVLLILYESAFLSFPTCCDLLCSRCTFPVQTLALLCVFWFVLNPVYLRESVRSHRVGGCSSNLGS